MTESKTDQAPRWDRIRQARERIAQGFYDRPEVRAEVIDRLLADVQDEEEDDLFRRKAR